MEPTEIDVLRQIYEQISIAVRPGVETAQLENLVADILDKTGAEGYFKGYRGFPNYISASVNNEILQTLPSSRRLDEGDILTIQTGVNFRGRFAYVGWTYPVGIISDRRQALLSAGRNSLDAALLTIKHGVTVAKVSKAMDAVIREAGYSPNSDFVGYQIGPKPTMPPQIPCSFTPSKSEHLLEEGMTLAIIAVLHEGGPGCEISSDGWGVNTKDHSDSALFSRLVRVNAFGCTVLSDFP